jgi:dihydropteroate synthase
LVKDKRNEPPFNVPFVRTYAHQEMHFQNRSFKWGERTYLMGIVNVTPDSFSGDGIHQNVSEAVRLACSLVDAGADCIDIGGESSRPNAEAITEDVELSRVLPVVEAISEALDVPISIDTRRSTVAEAAIRLGAEIVNDIYGLQGDPDMAAMCASFNVAIVIMHNQREHEDDSVKNSIHSGWSESLKIAEEAKIKMNRIILDPGFGFGWLPEQNLEMIRQFPSFTKYNFPLLFGPSRKSTLGVVLGDLPAEMRLEATLAASILAVAGGADLLRVHDVSEVARALKITDAVVRDP